MLWSVSGVVGNKRQVNYGAASTFHGAFAPAISSGWACLLTRST